MNVFLAVPFGGVALMPLLRGDLSVSLFLVALGAAVVLQVVLIFFVGKPGAVRDKFGVFFTFLFGVPYLMVFLVSIPFAGTLLAGGVLSLVLLQRLARATGLKTPLGSAVAAGERY